MYGGDEVSAIVIDLGSHTCKAGYAGEDAPKAVFPSVVGSIEQLEMVSDAKLEKESESMSDPKGGLKGFDSDKSKLKRKLYVGSQALGFRRDHMEVISPFKDGVVADWDIVDNIWAHAFRERLLIDPVEHPMLLAEPTSNAPLQRERMAELMFENYKVPALFVAKNAVLTSFASGRATSLVVDSGGGSTTVAPVQDGYVLQKGVATSPIGGEFLTECMMKSLESKGIILKPRYSFKRKEVRPGDFQRLIASDIKECLCRAPDTLYDDISVEFQTALSQVLDLITTHEGEKDLSKYKMHVEVNAIKELQAAMEETKVGDSAEGVHVHIVHLSDFGISLDVIKDAKSSGASVSVETCPHYLAFSAEEIKDGDTQFKCAPPIRCEANRQKLREALLTLNFLRKVTF